MAFTMLSYNYCNSQELKKSMNRMDYINLIKKQISSHYFFTKIDTTSIRNINDLSNNGNNKVDKENKNIKLIGPKPTGQVYKVWKQMRKECMSTQLINIDSLLYLGISNQMGLGQLFTIKKNRINPCYPSIIDAFSSDQKSLVLAPAQYSTCTVNRATSVGASFLVDANLCSGVEANLSSSVSSSKDVTATIDNWEIDYINDAGFSQVLSKSSEKKFNDYIYQLGQPNVYVITKVIKISGFSATIKTSTDISGNLKVQLTKGLIKNIGNSNATITFTYVDNRTIKATTQGEFIVFAEVMKGKQF